MDKLPIYININNEFYKKNPESSDLGKRIVSKSIEMIHGMGFEDFTFKKLGAQIGSNESSVYRYFENKHLLLIYLTNWYWGWLEYRLVTAIQNEANPKEKLRIALDILTRQVVKDVEFSYINEVLLHKIIINESSKAYHTKSVDDENQKGFFKSYKRIVRRVSDLVLTCKSDFEFPHMLISTVIEGVHQQRYFSEHLPSLTDFEKGKNNIIRFYKDMVFKTLEI